MGRRPYPRGAEGPSVAAPVRAPPPGWLPSARMSAFDDDTAVEAIGEGRFRGTVTDRWDIGTNPNGGYVLAIALGALARSLPHPDPLTVTAHYLRPPDKGPVDVATERVRAGRGHSTAEARLVQGGRERVRALATFGDLGRASGPTAVRVERPVLPPPEACLTLVDAPDALASPPELRWRLDTRLAPTTGWLRGERSGVARTDGWVRFADGREPDVTALAFFADAFPPAVFDLMEAARVPTLELTVHLRARPAPGWLQGHFETRALVGGYLEEDGALWDAEGRLVAMSRQLALLIAP